MPHPHHPSRARVCNSAPPSLFFMCVLAVVAQLMQAAPAWSCSCLSPAGPPCALGDGQVVFVGTMTSATEDRSGFGGSGLRRFQFTVTEAFAGVKGPHVEVQSDMTSCGVEFSEGQAYLVAGSRGPDGTPRVRACSYTNRLEDSRNEVEILRALRSGDKLTRLYGEVIEFREPGDDNLPTDPELYQRLPQVRVTAASADTFHETFTDAEGRFVFDDLPRGQYRVAIQIQAPKRVLPYSPGFHQSDADPAAVMLQDCPARVHFTVSEWKELIGNLPPILDPQPCPREPELKSDASTAAATIRFDNGRSSPVRVYWLDFTGRRVLYQSLTAGQTIYQPTYASHRWLVATEDDRCLGVYEPVGTRSIAEIQ
jgi:von Hippel-Lindau disease tumor supressor